MLTVENEMKGFAMLGIALALMLQSPTTMMDGNILYRVDATHVMVYSGRFNPDLATTRYMTQVNPPLFVEGPAYSNPGTHWILENATWSSGPPPWGRGFVLVQQTGFLPPVYRVYR